jgi:glycosyltransferase involved in cell wall biosynthesis
LKIAIVHDELMRRGGAEQVVLCFHSAFPDAPIYTIAYQPGQTYPEFKKCKIITSSFQPLAKNEKMLKMLFFPLGLWAMKRLDVTGYDVVLMSSTYSAKYVRVSPNALVINYAHSPFRLAWYPESYSEYTHSGGLKKWILKKVISALRKIDFKSAQRTDYFIANTKEMGQKLVDVYKPRNVVTVINPPVVTGNFYVSESIGEYFLVVCRLEYYKRVDIVIEAFNALGVPLVVVGKGSQLSKLKAMAKANIQFKSSLSKDDLAGLYSRCQALIFPQVEDYGITPLEANASGRPVIAFGRGGVLETMIPHKSTGSSATALFFEEQSTTSLIKAVKLFTTVKFDPKFIRAHAEEFNDSRFVARIAAFVSEKYCHQ